MSQPHKIRGPFVGRTREMLKSAAFRSLSLTALRILARIEIEHMNHGGRDNGQLPVTYRDLVEYGITRHCIGGAILELVAAGFIEVTRRGRAGNSAFCHPSLYRLTYVHTRTAEPSDDWERYDAKPARAQRAKIQKPKVTKGNRRRTTKGNRLALYRTTKGNRLTQISRTTKGNHFLEEGLAISSPDDGGADPPRGPGRRRAARSRSANPTFHKRRTK